MYGAQGISVELTQTTLTEVMNAFSQLGIDEPTHEQINDLCQHLRDAAIRGAREALDLWIEDKKGYNDGTTH